MRLQCGISPSVVPFRRVFSFSQQDVLWSGATRRQKTFSQQDLVSFSAVQHLRIESFREVKIFSQWPSYAIDDSYFASAVWPPKGCSVGMSEATNDCVQNAYELVSAYHAEVDKGEPRLSQFDIFHLSTPEKPEGKEVFSTRLHTFKALLDHGFLIESGIPDMLREFSKPGFLEWTATQMAISRSESQAPPDVAPTAVPVQQSWASVISSYAKSLIGATERTPQPPALPSEVLPPAPSVPPPPPRGGLHTVRRADYFALLAKSKPTEALASYFAKCCHGIPHASSDVVTAFETLLSGMLPSFRAGNLTKLWVATIAEFSPEGDGAGYASSCPHRVGCHLLIVDSAVPRGLVMSWAYSRPA